MSRFGSWFSKVTLGNPGKCAKMSLWLVFDNYIAAIPYAVMLAAIALFLVPVEDPGRALPVAQIAVLCVVLAVHALGYYFVARKSYMVSTAEFAQVIRRSRRSMAEQLRRLPMGFYSGRDAGDLVTVLLRDFGVVEANNDTVIPKAAVVIARTSAVLVAFSVFDWRMTMAAFSVIPLSVPFAVAAYRRLSRTNEGLLAAQQDNSSRILEYVEGMQTLKAFNHEGTMYRSLQASCNDLRRLCIEAEKASVSVSMLARGVLNAGSAVVMAVGLRLLSEGSLSPFAFMVFLLLALSLYGPIMSFMMMLVNITQLDRCAGRVDEIMREKPLPSSSEPEVPDDGGIRFEDVSFGYGSEDVLRGVSFDIPDKGLTALVGPSGSGKSTVVRLMARFWDVGSGRIVLGGAQLSNVAPEEALRHVSVVFQETYLFNDTVEANVRIGKADASREEVEQACRRAACHDFISALPDGYETVVGEAGATLSGGERQRISIARALLKDAPVVLLDEATASLDSENEALVQQAIDALVRNRTVVVIAHRLRSVLNADQIVVLDKGRVVQTGTHEELAAEEGLYKRLWDVQRRASAWVLGG